MISGTNNGSAVPHSVADQVQAAGMTSVLVVSGDGTIRAEVRNSATAAGVGVVEHTGLTAVRDSWSAMAIVFLGSDLSQAAVDEALPPTRELILVARGTRYPPFSDAAALGAAYVVLLPVGRTWLTDRIRRAARS